MSTQITLNGSSPYADLRTIFEKKKSDLLQKEAVEHFLNSNTFSNREDAVNKIVNVTLEEIAKEIKKYPQLCQLLQKENKAPEEYVKRYTSTVFEKVKQITESCSFQEDSSSIESILKKSNPLFFLQNLLNYMLSYPKKSV